MDLQIFLISVLIILYSFISTVLADACEVQMAGHDFSCSTTPAKTLRCWGNDNYGQLGYELFGDKTIGDEPFEMGSYLAEAKLGSTHELFYWTTSGLFSCALLNPSDVKCWGLGFSGRNGQGDTNHIGDANFEMGDYLDVVNFGTSFWVLTIQSGYTHSCVLFTALSIKCWGENTLGSLGYGDGNDRGDNPMEMGDYLPLVDVGSGLIIGEVRPALGFLPFYYFVLYFD